MTVEQLREALDYDVETGVFTRRTGPKSGRRADRPHPSGYRVVTVHGRTWRAHVLAVVYMTGSTPRPGLMVDHRNGDKHDNSWTNLKVTNNSVNQHSRHLNAKQDAGVGLSVKNLTWQVKVFIGGVKHVRYGFADKAEAVEYVVALRKQYIERLASDC